MLVFFQLGKVFFSKSLLFFCSWSLYDPVFPQAFPAQLKKVKIRATSGQVHLRDLLESRVMRPQNHLRLKQRVLLSSASLLQLTPRPSLSPQVNPGLPVTSVLQGKMWRHLVAQMKHLSRLRTMTLSKKMNQSPKLSQNHNRKQRTERTTLKSEYLPLTLPFKLLFKIDVIVLLIKIIF